MAQTESESEADKKQIVVDSMQLKAYEPKFTRDHTKQVILAQTESEADKKYKVIDSMDMKAFEPTKIEK